MRRLIGLFFVFIVIIGGNFAQTDEFRVTEVLPSPNSQYISTDSLITVIFNRPVIPLGTVADLQNAPDPLIIDPPIQGEGEWINTSIYTFKPLPAWGGNTTYTVTVPAGFAAVDGSTLAQDFTWQFTTEKPYVLEIYPLDASADVPLDDSLYIAFTAPIDQSSFEANFVLRPVGSSEAIPGEFEWNDAGDAVTFLPDDLLQIDTRYEVGFPPDSVYDAVGISTLDALFWQFSTVPYPAIISTYPRDGEDDVQLYGSISLQFASPMDQETLEDKITIDPEPWIDPEFYYYTWDDSLQITFPIEPSTDYTISIAPGMADIYGNIIDEPFSFSFTTAPYAPDVNLSVPGSVGFYNATREQTQVFVSHLNVSELNLTLYNIPTRTFRSIALSDDSYYRMNTYDPEPSSIIRNWTIESVAPLNARRYELLNLGEGVGVEGAVCAGALPSRFGVGDTAVVISDPDPVRARLEPVTGEIIDLLYRDYALPVIGGPECSEGITWWQVRLRDGNPAWVAEGFDGEYVLDLRTPAQSTPVIVQQENGEALTPGVYFLKVTSPETNARGYSPQRHFMVVANANLVMKMTNEALLVWALDVQTGLPLANVPIDIYGRGLDPIASGVTDEEGLARIDIPRITNYAPRLALLHTDEYFGMGISTWSNGIEGWDFNVPYQFLPDQYSVYIYTDRPLYRPDQPVHFRGVVRVKDDVTYTLPDMETVPVQIYDDDGELIYSRDLPLTPYGTFSDTFELAEDAGLGYYRIQVELPSDYEWGNEGGSVSFGVAEYRLPEFQVEVTPQTDQVIQGETITVAVDSTYFFGGKVSNAVVEYNVVADPYFFRYDGPGYYDFIDYSPDAGPSEYYGSESGLIASGEGITDSRGTFLIEIPANLQDSTQSMTFTIEATVRDESDQVVAGRTGVVVHQGEFYIGVRPERYVGVAQQESMLEFIAVDWESQPIAEQTIDVEIFERRWSSVQEEDASGRTVWTWEVEDIPVESTQVTTGDNGKAQYTFVPPTGGIYAIRITSRDSNGNEIRASTTMWVSGQQYVNWRQQNSNRIDLIADRTDYNIGDTAEILIASPFQGTAQALITVERGGVLQVERVTMDTNSYVYRLPITEEFAPNVFVSVLIIKGVDETNPVAAFRMGMIRLSVETSQKEILFDIATDADQAGPGDTVTYTIRTMNYAGEPIQAEVGVGLTDLASLSIAEPNSRPILDYFYDLQPLGVRTATPLTINTDQLTQTVLDTIKGGGGGFGEGGIFDIREDFVDTAYWNAELVTDENGYATFDVTLPDNLTTWRLDARAVTMGDDGLTLVGQQTFDLLSTKPLLIRPVTPRFFIVGDQVQLAAVVNNNTDSTQSIEIALEGTGFTFGENPPIQTFVVEAGARVRAVWDVTIDNVEFVDLTFFTRSQDDLFTDASKPALGQGDDRLLPVYRYEAPEIVGTGGTLRDADTRTEAILVPEFVTQGELTLTIEPSLAATSIQALDYLKNCGCNHAEAIISRLLPNVITLQALTRLGVSDPELEASLISGVEYAVQQLYAYQKVDGGWGWYVQDHSNPLVTAYALIGLHTARENGFAVSDTVIHNAQTYLQGELITPGLNVETWRLNRQAFILYALAYSGQPDIARTTTLFDSRERLDTYAKAFLLLTFDIIGNNEDRINTLITDLRDQAIVSANGTHWEDPRDYWNWNTNTRTTALVLQALVKVRPDSDLIPNIVRWLMVARSADAWETTQETAWVVMALTEWMVTSNELNADYTYEVGLNDAPILTGAVTPQNVTQSQQLMLDVALLLRDQANQLTIERGAGQGNLYYTAYLRTFLPVPEIEALNRGIIVQRHYTLIDDPDRTPITQARIGDVVQVHLTIIVPNDLHYVVIEDPIPAGADAINPGLSTSQQIGTRPGLDTNDPLSRGWGWWWFSNIEFRDEKVVLSSTYLPAGAYEYVYTIRPGLEGVYNVIPPTGREFYFPDVFGRGDGMAFTILPAE